MQDVVRYGGYLPKILQVHIEYIQQGIGDVLHNLQAQTVNPLDKALKNSFKDTAHPLSAGASVSPAWQGHQTGDGCMPGKPPSR